MKKDPIFGVEALDELGKKAEMVLKPFPKIRESTKRLKIRNTRLYRNRLRYLWGAEGAEDE